MKVIYSDHEPKFDNHHSIFLVGPTPRSPAVPSWRPEAIKILEDLGYKGTVFIPEWSDHKSQTTYINQVEWEYACLSNCHHIAAWVPRCMDTMPAMTTNVEFGYWISNRPNNFYYGRPDGAPHTNYLDWLYNKVTNREAVSSLQQLLEDVVREQFIKAVYKSLTDEGGEQ